MTLELSYFGVDIGDLYREAPLGVGSRVSLPDGSMGIVVCEIPSFGLLWLVRVQRRVGFEVFTVRGSSLRVLS